MLDFVCVGGNKCGTTWLYELLRQHPKLNVSTNKEPHYFSHNYHKGEEWYGKNWSCQQGLRGEFSTSYLYSDEAIRRMVEDCSGVKIVIMLRHPLDRAVSHLRHVMRAGKYASCKQALDEHPEVVRNSFYADRIKKFEHAFGVEHVQVCFFDAVESAPNELVRCLFFFLDVDEEFEPEGLREVVGQGYKPQFPLLDKLRLKVYRFMKRHRLYDLIRLVKSTGVTKKYKQINARDDNHREERQLLQKYRTSYCKDIRDLVQLRSIENTAYAREWIASLCNESL